MTLCVGKVSRHKTRWRSTANQPTTTTTAATMPARLKRELKSRTGRRRVAPLVVDMLFERSEGYPDIIVPGSMLEGLSTIASLLANAVTRAPSVTTLITARTGMSLPAVEGLVAKYAVDFPNLLDTEASHHREACRRYFRALRSLVMTDYFGVTPGEKDNAIQQLNTLIHSVNLRSSYEQPSNGRQISFFSRDCTKRLWPFLDSIDILYSIDSRLTRAATWSGLDRILHDVPCIQCSQCDGQWHAFMPIVPYDQDGPKMLLNFHSNPPALSTIDGDHNKCQICWKSILCCTDDGIATECNECGVLMCCVCEEEHRREHRREERIREKKRMKRVAAI